MEKTAQKNPGSGVYPVFYQYCILVAAGLRLYGTLPLAVHVFMGMLLVCNISIILSTFLLDKFYIVNLQENFKNLEHLNLKLRAERHEYLNEMQVVYGLLELEEYEEAYRYLLPLYEDIARIGKAVRTKKPAVMPCFRQKWSMRRSSRLHFLWKCRQIWRHFPWSSGKCAGFLAI